MKVRCKDCGQEFQVGDGPEAFQVGFDHGWEGCELRNRGEAGMAGPNHPAWAYALAGVPLGIFAAFTFVPAFQTIWQALADGLRGNPLLWQLPTLGLAFVVCSIGLWMAFGRQRGA